LDIGVLDNVGTRARAADVSWWFRALQIVYRGGGCAKASLQARETVAAINASVAPASGVAIFFI
jgi:hypothetical protein